MAVIPTLYEGPEKKIEVLLRTPHKTLRSNSDGRWQRVARAGRWQRVARAGRAAIVSSISNASLDAYLLSESSLFVWEDRILMITCGRTTPLEAVPEIMAIAGKENIAMIFYERKNFLFPENQPSDFEMDIRTLETHFCGRSYRFGPANGDHVHVFFSSQNRYRPEKDVTFQILMSDLPSKVTRGYEMDSGKNAVHTLQVDLLNLYPGMVFDSHLFSPFGCSLNGIRDAGYVTVHVTPQQEGSYTSFETNIMADDYSDMVGHMVSLFRPQRFSIVLTSSLESGFMGLHETLRTRIPGYRMTERSLNHFDCGYAMTYVNCEASAHP